MNYVHVCTHAQTAQTSECYVLGSLCTEGNQPDLASVLKKPAFSEGTGKRAEQTNCADSL